MKKLILFSVMCCVSLAASPCLQAATPDMTYTATARPDTAGLSKMLHRLDQIQRMDKSKLSSSEKKELRKEVRGIKAKLKDIGGGFYISAGTLILILILLIILL